MEGLNAAFCRAALKSKTHFCLLHLRSRSNKTQQLRAVREQWILWTHAEFSQLTVYLYGYS